MEEDGGEDEEIFCADNLDQSISKTLFRLAVVDVAFVVPPRSILNSVKDLAVACTFMFTSKALFVKVLLSRLFGGLLGDAGRGIYKRL